MQHEGTAVAVHDFVRCSEGVLGAGSARVAYIEDLVQAEGEDVVLGVRWLQFAGENQTESTFCRPFCSSFE